MFFETQTDLIMPENNRCTNNFLLISILGILIELIFSFFSFYSLLNFFLKHILRFEVLK